MKLGKLPPRADAKRLKLSKYLPSSLPAPLPEIDWTKGITDFGMMLNDDLGDCTCAGLGHAEQIWTANTTSEITPADTDVLKLYEQSCGYNPSDPNTDQGGVEVDVLNFVRKNGLFSDTLIAYADPDPGNQDHVKKAISLFGGVYIGLSLPLSAQDQVGKIWDVVPGSEAGSWGGHAVFVPKYSPEGLTCITWGKLQLMTWDFWKAYCDESHALLAQSWMAEFPSETAQTLQNDLQDVSD